LKVAIFKNNHGQLYGLIEWKGEKLLYVHYLGGLKKCWVGVPHSYEGFGVDRRNQWVVCGSLFNNMGNWWVVHGLHRKESGEWGCGSV
jgi:hypothetical protein